MEREAGPGAHAFVRVHVFCFGVSGLGLDGSVQS